MTQKFISRQKSQSPTSSPPIQTSRFASRPFAEPVQQKAEQSNLQTILQRAERAGNPTAKMAWGNQPEVQRQGVTENETEELKVQKEAATNTQSQDLEEQKDTEVQTQLDTTIQQQESEQKPEEETVQKQSTPEEEQKDTEVQTQLDSTIQSQESSQKPEEETVQKQSTPEEEQKDSEVQTKLTVGQPGDKYETEADNVAARVMTMPETETEENTPQSQDIEKEESTVQKQPIAQSITSVQRRLESQVDPERSRRVNLKSVRDNKAEKKQVTPSLENRLASQKGGGSLLPEETRSFMESRFGADFSEVRVHAGSQAAQMNQELGAQAFTHGNDIYFNSGKYDPSSGKGKELLAHELTHTIQQTGGKTAKSNNKKSSKDNKVQTKPSMTPLAEPTIQRREDPSAAAPAVATPSTVEGGTSDTPEAAGGETASSEQTPASSGSTPPSEGGGASSSGGGSSNGGGIDASGQGNAFASQEVVSLKAEDPGQILEQLKNTPPTQAATAYEQAQTASASAWENQHQQVQETLPEIPAPTGLPPQDSAKKSPEQGTEEATGEPKSSTGKASPAENLSKGEGGSFSKIASVMGGFFPGVPTQAQAQSGEGSEQEVSQVESVDDISQVNTSAGERPNVELTGETDPAQMDATQAESNHQVQGAKTQAAGNINQDFGENNIFPQASDDILKANKQFSPLKPPIEKNAKAPLVPPEVVGGLNQGLTPFYQEKITPEQEKYKAEKNKFDADSVNAKSDADQEIINLNEEAKQKQLTEQQQAQEGVSQARKDWQTELDNVDKDYQEKAGKATKEQRQKIDDKKAEAEAEADRHLTEAEQKAEEEKHKSEEEARKKEEEANQDKSIWEQIGDVLESIWDAIKQAVETIFNALREAIKAIFEAAKALVNSVIDLARQAIIGLIQGLGEILKGIVNIALAAFPEIAKKFTDKIDEITNKATEAVNAVADFLKNAVSSVLDFLANTLDTLLGILQDVFTGIMTVIGMVITGEFGELIERFGNLIEGAKAMPPQFETAGLEELMGGDVDLDKPLSPEELAQAEQAGVDIPEPEGENAPQMGETGGMPSAPWTEENVGVDAVENNMELSPEIVDELMQKTNGQGEVSLAESDEQSRSMDAIMDEATEMQEAGGEKQEQQIPDDGLTPKQRASVKWEMMKQGIKQWFSDNWPILLAGLIAASAVIIAAIVASGGAVLAALPMIMQVLTVVFAAEVIAKIGGYLRDYLSKSWEGDIQGGGKSLAKALAAGAIELIMLLTAGAGKVVTKGAKAVGKGAKAAAKGAAKVATKATQAVVKGAKYTIKKGKVLFKGVAGTNIGKQFKKLDDLGQGLLNKMRFKAFRIKVKNRRFRLEGLVNPWVLLANGEVRDIKTFKGDKTLGGTGKWSLRRGVIIGERRLASKAVKRIKEMNNDERKKLFNRFDKVDKNKRKTMITGNRTPEKFPLNATVDDVVENLTGDATTSSFKPYYKVLETEGILDNNKLKEAIAQMKFKGRGVDDVRHELKVKYREELLERMTKNSDNKFNYREMLRLTENLNPSDKGNLAELWYKKVYGSGSSTHVKVTPDNIKTLNPGIKDTDIISQDRLPDAIIGNTLREQKHIAGTLNDHDLTQFDDFMKLRGKNIPTKDGASLNIKDVKYTFTNPKGVKENADWMKTQLNNNDNLSFEIFNAQGELKIITRADSDFLKEPNLSQWLDLP